MCFLSNNCRKVWGIFWVQFQGLWDVCYLVNLALVFLVLLPLYFFFFFPDVAEAQTVRLFLCPIWIYCSGAPIHRSFWQFFLFSDSSDYHSGPRRNPKLTQRSSGYGPNMVAVPTRSWESEKKHLESCRLFFFGTKKNNTPSEARPRLSA